MKQTFLLVFVALAIMLAPAALFAADGCCPTGQGPQTCETCPAPAWDPSPIYVQGPNNPYCPPGTPVEYWAVNPMVKCGAFCAAGNLPPGWPYGWGAQYWLRPNTNF